MFVLKTRVYIYFFASKFRKIRIFLIFRRKSFSRSFFEDVEISVEKMSQFPFVVLNQQKV